ncbi:MAG: hypothetical protein ACYSSI_12005, partial [Planctomycetota bacterium]
ISSVTCAPGAESSNVIVMVVSVICSILFGGIAVYLKKLSKRETHKKCYESKWLLILYMGFAIIMTLLILFSMLA